MKRPLIKQLLVIIVGSFIFGISFSIIAKRHKSAAPEAAGRWKLYWFVPDGLRADPEVFNLFDWAEQGHLPNIKQMMRQGTYGYSIPVFPSHTPVNFATLFTGTRPIRHGVADGPIRVQGYPLKIIPRSGFSSIAKIIDPFWYTLEQAGLIVSLLSVPGSTPPEINNGHVVKGRWGGWGMEFPSINFHSHADEAFRRELGWNDKVFQVEKKLTEFTAATAPTGWFETPASFSPAREVNLRNWDTDLFALLTDSTDDHQENYDTVHFSPDKKTKLFSLKAGEWSEWFQLTLNYRVQKNYQDEVPQKLELEQRLATLQFPTAVKVKVLQLGQRDHFRIRVLYDGLNESVTLPSHLAANLREAAGPMVDFVDNFPPQLIYFSEDKAAFQDEMEMSFQWHERAQKFFFREVRQDVFVHSVYSPNQMLTSRWWMNKIDPRGRDYATTSETERARLWSEVRAMYQRIDALIGEALKARPDDAYVVLSSDHGAIPLNYEVKLNNFFVKKGWLAFVKDAAGHPRVDWPGTRVIFLNMNHIFIHPGGLGGDYRPAKGAEYERLRKDVMDSLKGLRDATGQAPLADVLLREQAHEWGLPAERVGDLVIAANTGFGWIEDISEDLEVFTSALKGGYKQAVRPQQDKGLWTPFIIVGPGVRANHRLIRPVSHIDQYPTVMRLMNIKLPYRPDGGVIQEVFE